MWAREWERRVARPWVFGPRYITFSLASNENVDPASETARALWTREYNRAALMRNWSTRRVDMAYRAKSSDRASIDVCVSVRFADDGETGFVLVDVGLERLECSLDEAARYASVSVHDALRDGMSFASLSRNPNIRPCDVVTAPSEAWDASALASRTANKRQSTAQRRIQAPRDSKTPDTVWAQAIWELFLRNTDSPADAICEAEKVGLGSEIIIRGATSNANLCLRDAARLGALIAGRPWLVSTLVANPMRAARAEFELASTLISIVVLARRLPWHVGPVIARWTLFA